MRFVVLVKPAGAEHAPPPTAERLAPMGRFNEGLEKAGVILAEEGLHPSSHAARLDFSGGKAAVTDGPFAETKELIYGFWIVQAKSKAEVIERFSHAPMEDGDQLEIREIFELGDLGL